MLQQWMIKFQFILICVAPALALANPVQSDHIEVELIAEVTAVQAGKPFWLGLRLTPEAHWKTYWRNPGEFGLATYIEWNLPEGATAGEIQWPFPEQFEGAGVASYGYDGEALLLTEIQVPEELKTGDDFPVSATASWLVCSDVCIPGNADLSLALPVSAAPAELNSRWSSLFAATRERLPQEIKGLQASFAFQDDQLHLEVVAPEPVFTDAEDVLFFPIEQEIVSNTAIPEKDWTPTRFQLKKQKSEDLTDTPNTLSGLIVVKAAGRSTAYAMLASPDPGLQSAPVEVATLLYVMLLAIIGGILLNLMPCVFPVLALKAIALLEASNISTRAQQLHGIAYTVGVMVFFFIVAAVLYLLKAAGVSIGWGFQLQNPWFVAVLAYLLFVLGLNFSGLLQFGGRFMGVGESLTHRGGYVGSFFTGALAAIVASPCTAPFMGTAIGFALTQSAFHSSTVFLSLGFGMALPFLLITLVPRLGRFLPKPGPWMNIFKQAMAFPLYLTAIWLLWVLGRQTSATGMAAVLVGILLLVFAIWLQHIKPRSQTFWRHTPATLGIAAIVGAFTILTTSALQANTPGVGEQSTGEDSFWEPYSEERLVELRALRQPVFVNMTADWCITCIANERVALSLNSVRQAFKEKNIVALKGDWTNRRPDITRYLETFSRNGVPIYVLYPRDANTQPMVLPQWLSPTTVLEAVEKI